MQSTLQIQNKYVLYVFKWSVAYYFMLNASNTVLTDNAKCGRMRK